MDALYIDLRDAVRRLRAKAAFAFVAATVLAVGIGATSVLFSIGHAILLRPLPYEAPERLVRLIPVRPGAGANTLTFSEGEYIEIERRTSAFDALAAYHPSRSVSVATDGPAVQVPATRATANLFETLGTTLLLGRSFDAEETSPQGPLAVILSHAFWLERFGGDPGIVGRSLVVDDLAHVVIGVAKESFRFPDAATRLWLPLALDRADVNYQSGQYLGIVGRVTPRVERGMAQDDLGRVTAQLTDEGLTRYAGMSARIVDLREDLVGNAREPLIVLIGVVSLVLAAICFNLGGFFLSHVMARRSELTVRAALGAGRGRLIRSALTEVVLLSGVGALVGAWLASETFQVLHVARPSFLPRAEELSIDGSLLWLAATLAAVAAILFGVGPALLVQHMGSTESLRVRDPFTGHRSSTRVRSFLVTAQIAASVVLLVGGGLLLGSLLRLGRVDPGFDPDRVVTFGISLPTSTYPADARAHAFYFEALSRIRAMPGVAAAGATTILPMSGLRSYGFAWREDQVGDRDVAPHGFDMRWVSAGFFETMRVSLVDGRVFNEGDTPGALPSAVLSRSLARALWPNGGAVGERFKLGRLVDDEAPWIIVIGVVEDVHQTSKRLPAAPAAYFAEGQLYTPRQMSFVIRTTLPLSSVAEGIRGEIAAIDPGRPVYAVVPMPDLVDGSMTMLRYSTALVVGFAALVVIITLVGLYGLLAYSGRLRAHEFTIRMILGAPPRKIARSLMCESAQLCAVGISLGLLAALGLGRFLQSLLFGVEASDLWTLLGAAMLVAITSLLASLGPARRATVMDPGRLLRE